jgi:hypothetical protein
MTSKTYRVLLAAGMAAMLFFLGFSVAKLTPREPVKGQDIQQTQSDELAQQTVSVIIDGDDGPVAVPDVAWEEGMTVFKALQKSAEKAAFNLEYKDYGGDMGVFITSINGQDGANKQAWWQFWVDGNYADKGASVYMLPPGASVYWTLSSKMP